MLFRSPKPTLDLIVEDFRGREVDPVIHQDFDKFVFDDDFVKSRAFKQFLWRISMHNIQLKCKKIKAKQPDVEESTIEEVVKDELTQIFDDITPEGGRLLLKDAGILILLEWDIANAMVFDAIRREGQTRFKIEEKVHMAHKGVKFRHQTRLQAL